MPASEPLVIRSYRGVFRFTRRLYRIDRWRLPLRQGLPLPALLYAPAVYALVAVLSALPLLGDALALLPAPLHWALLPALLVAGLLQVRVQGRSAHRTLWACARWALAPRRLAGLRPCPPAHGPLALTGLLVVRPDTRSVRYRGGRIEGPAQVLLQAPAALEAGRSRRALTLVPAPADAPPGTRRVIDVPARARLVLR